ncbi:hypothetical protein [Natranaerobius thermophilus]|uniref:Uncharacterized protein n=1 Tax=Natranaerobius thermophilus (strain ATCC BAA-1301 / DSM 18059 / JW/NM-WN-LF) TaxID=457570 RepID=B2A111_NATTJ|nr:hypothetical protein [Natranaerobius thermophilus]ACB84634.1 hypothetical protein Nther_1050 [Natranaerobius thermophilus JW/NM-WN-LF]
MKDFSTIWYTFILFILGVASFFTGEVVTFFMLGFIILILTNIYNALKKILEKLDKLH